MMQAWTESPGPYSSDRDDVEREHSLAAMGGSVNLRLVCPATASERADRDLRRVAARITAWAGRLTRFSPDSDLAALNCDPGAARAHVRPTIHAVLERSRGLQMRTAGIVNVGLLGARVAAEDGGEPPRDTGHWWLEGQGRTRAVRRTGSVVFDLDGVGKGWIADRALRLLRAYPAALVDADGDIAMRVAATDAWPVAVADPRREGAELARLGLPRGWPTQTLGIATSGTSIHRWERDDGASHHLIDPRTARPARTDVVQATVIAESALVAEALAKTVVILGSEAGLDFLEQAGAMAEVLLLENGEVIAMMHSLEWLH